MTEARRLGIDVGGTIIDFVTLDPETGSVTIKKVRSAGVGAEYYEMGGTGHLMHIEKQREFNQQIVGYVRALSSD